MASSVVELTAGLVAERGAHRIAIGRPGTNRPSLHFIVDGDRLSVRLVVLGVPTADLTAHPGAVVALIAGEAEAVGADPNGWTGAVHAYFRRQGLAWQPRLAPPGSRCAEIPSGRPSASLLRLLGGLAFPLLRSVYETAVVPLGEVPHWAAAALAAPAAADGARVAFAGRATRPLARALVASLIPPTTGGPEVGVALGPLAVALVGADMLEPDHLRQLLEPQSPWQPPHRWPTDRQLRIGRQAASALGVGGLLPILREGRGDPQALFEVLRLVSAAEGRLRRPFPTNLHDLRQHCELALAPSRVSGRRPNDPHDVPSVPRRLRSEEPQSAPDAPRRTAGEDLPISHELAPADGRRVGELRLRLPRGSYELNQWGVDLQNCLGTFADAVAAGRSWLIGIEDETGLIGCVEVTPASRSLRQLLGPQNHRLSRAVTAAVTSELVALGIIDTTQPSLSG